SRCCGASGDSDGDGMIRLGVGDGISGAGGGRPGPRLHRVGPLGGLVAMIGVAAMAVLALVTLGIAAWVMRRRKPAAGAGAHVGGREAPPVGAGREASPL